MTHLESRFSWEISHQARLPCSQFLYLPGIQEEASLQSQVLSQRPSTKLSYHPTTTKNISAGRL